MKRLLIITSIIVLSIIYYFYSIELEKKTFIQNINDQRIEKNEDMYKSESSPLFNSDYKIEYFPPNIDFKVIAKINRLTNNDTIKFVTSKGTSKAYLKFALLEFKLKEKIHKLPIYKSFKQSNKNEILLCFNDKTNGISTYEGGRYIDISFKNAQRIEIDFNKAYNPFCVYNAKYICPIPPKENFIDEEIIAGEKIYLN
ncbi:MAG TPA: DUF1684 domain-containing protein [Cytophagales bacterium]|jgi:uncharacterized protein (DUF1684 family)|nr:DUF1684 domain-containing protein [Cytophagales bacterium]